MDGRGRCKDNIWIERFWQSIVYLSLPTNDVKKLRMGIDRWIRYSNYQRPYQGLEGAIPSNVYQMVA